MARRYNEVNMSSPEVVVDQRHLVHNVEQLRKLSGQAAVFPVIKANAYGHGLVPVAKILETSVPNCLQHIFRNAHLYSYPE